jgi:hypothetical protein
MITRDPLGTWETLSSPSSNAGGSPVDQLQDDPQSGPRLWGRTGDETMVSRRAGKETKCGEKDGRESERLIVPMSRGNHPERTPRREGDAVS